MNVHELSWTIESIDGPWWQKDITHEERLQRGVHRSASSTRAH